MAIDKGVESADSLSEVAKSHTFYESLSAALDDKAAKIGDIVAANFFDDGVEITYAELSKASKRLSSGLLRMGVRKGTHVALMVPNSVEFLIAWFGIMRLGAVMVPVNDRYLSRELNYVLEDADVQFLIIHEDCHRSLLGIEALPALLADGAIVTVRGELRDNWVDFHDLLENGNENFESPVPVAPTDLANIQYTSGTTGFPKGCMQPHLYWLMIGYSGSIAKNWPDHDTKMKNILITYPFFYMMPQYEFMLALYCEGTVFVARRASLKKLIGWIKAYHIHYCAMNPMALRGLPPEHPSDAENDLVYIAAYYHAGEAQRNLEKRFNAVGRNSFGMTEIGVGTACPVAATHMADTGTCGLAAPFREVRICDENGVEVPRGEDGELCFAGDGIFLGYYKRPKANCENFHGRWFRTGDIARMDENGYIFVVGRIKEMVKRSGENISAAEVESVLQEHPHVREAAAVAVPDERRMEEVKVYISLRNGKSKEDVPPSELLYHCSERLARFKIPRYYAYVDDFPRTASRKISKPDLVKQTPDLREQSFDSVDQVWR